MNLNLVDDGLMAKLLSELPTPNQEATPSSKKASNGKAKAGTNPPSHEASDWGNGNSIFDLRAHVERDFPGAKHKLEKNRELWELPECPFRPDDGKSAYVGKVKDGGFFAGCQHETCPGNNKNGSGWASLCKKMGWDTKRSQTKEDEEKEASPKLILQDTSEWGIRKPPEPEWLLEGLIARREAGILAARPNAGKGLLSFQIAGAIATGTQLFGLSSCLTPFGVIIVQMEDSPEELERRFSRLLALMKQDRDWSDEKEEKLRKNIHFLTPNWNNPDLKTLDELVPQIKTHIDDFHANGMEIGLIILDTLTTLIGGDENAVEDNRALWPSAYQLRDYSKANIMIVHHVRKAYDGKPTPIAGRLSMDTIRGSSAITGGARCVLQMEPLTQAEAKRLNLCEEKALRGGYVVLGTTKVVSGPKGDWKLLEQIDYGDQGAGLWVMHPDSDKLVVQLNSKAAIEQLSLMESVLLSIFQGTTDREALGKKHWPNESPNNASDKLKAVLNKLRNIKKWIEKGRSMELTKEGVEKAKSLKQNGQSFSTENSNLLEETAFF